MKALDALSLDKLDPALEHRVRLAIAVLLARHGEVSFAAFKQQLQLTDGNWRTTATSRCGATSSSADR